MMSGSCDQPFGPTSALKRSSRAAESGVAVGTAVWAVMVFSASSGGAGEAVVDGKAEAMGGDRHDRDPVQPRLMIQRMQPGVKPCGDTGEIPGRKRGGEGKRWVERVATGG